MCLLKNNPRVVLTALLSVGAVTAGCREPVAPVPESAAVDDGVSLMTSAPHSHTNRLIDSTSPYLLQHAHNPVDWYPWGEEALGRARAEQKPIFLSIGYSACHWCHVMAHESFESETIADLLNAHFISIKVDREERPDLDALYMSAVQAMTGSGGWPMSVFLTPDLEPFYGGTYFPPDDRWGRPGFATVLDQLAAAWQSDPAELTGRAGELTQHLRQTVGRAVRGDEGDVDAAAVIEAAQRELAGSYDAEWGGFAGAPKFPNVAGIAFLLRRGIRGGDSASLEMAGHTLARMARGGMYDHVGGGFHRYSVDGEWLVPHFEKMLYDNARLAGLYADAYRAIGDPFLGRIARQTVDYLLRDMRSDTGGFYSAEDADSEGGEGAFYTWTQAELDTVLGPEDGALIGRVYGVTPDGNFEGRTILHLGRPPDDIARAEGSGPEAFWKRVDPLLSKLRQARSKRPRPLRDDKMLAAWNGMAIAGVARVGVRLGEPPFVAAAVEAGEAVWRELRDGDRLWRSYRDGRAHTLGFLDDYAHVLDGYVSLYEATFDAVWLERATRLADRMVEEFSDREAGGFFYTSEKHERLLYREKPLMDGATPSGNAQAATALLRLHALTGHERHRTAAEGAVRGAGAALKQYPQALLHMVEALERLSGQGVDVLVVGQRALPETQRLLTEVQRSGPGLVALAHVEPGGMTPSGLAPALTEGRELVDGVPTAYVCHGEHCLPPVTSVEALREALRAGQRTKP